jgi:hypothetical protein
MTERAQRVVALIVVGILLVAVWCIIEWRTAPPPPPAVQLPYPPVP